MSRSLGDRLRRRLAGADAGFGIVETLISMLIFGIVAVATLPMLIGGLTAGRTAQLNLQGKALGQERLEQMRNLPYHVARQNGQYLDVLDIYFRDTQSTGVLAPADRCSARSYVAATATYSCTITSLGAEYGLFRQVVQTQFLDFQRNVVTPPAGYTSQTAGMDSPVANLLGVTVTTSWTQAGRVRSFPVRSHIANAQAEGSLIRAAVQSSALKVTSELVGGDLLQFEGGLVSGEGSLTTGSTASLSVAVARAARASGTSVGGASLSLNAPPTASGASPSLSGKYLDGSTCLIACFGQTAVSGNQQVAVTSGQPTVSLATDPVTGTLRRTGANVFRGFSYNNAPLADTSPALGLNGPMVSGGVGSTTEVLSGAGYLDAAGTGAAAVRSGSSVALPVLELFPTAFAPSGVVQVTLTGASLQCSSGGGNAAVTANWGGQVRYWSGASGAYVPLSLAPGAAALPDPTLVEVVAASATTPATTLSTWVAAWSALTDPAAAVASAGRQAKGEVSSVLSILTSETRSSDPTSALNIAVGAMSCLAEDNR